MIVVGINHLTSFIVQRFKPMNIQASFTNFGMRKTQKIYCFVLALTLNFIKWNNAEVHTHWSVQLLKPDSSMLNRESCTLDADNFMNALFLRDCLTSLGSDPGFHQIEYIETHYGHDDYLQDICNSINSNLIYNKSLTEAQNDACPSNEDGWMYPSYCNLGYLECETTKNGCLWPNYKGFYCSESISTTTISSSTSITTTSTGCQTNADCPISKPFCHQGMCYECERIADCQILYEVCIDGYCLDHDDCFPNPCENGGSCQDYRNDYNCTCNPGWEGKKCNINHDDCTPNPCHNGGTCQDLTNDYNCICPSGWTGKNCSVEYETCDRNSDCSTHFCIKANNTCSVCSSDDQCREQWESETHCVEGGCYEYECTKNFDCSSNACDTTTGNCYNFNNYYCYGDEIGRYPSLDEAVVKCNENHNCRCIVDLNCDGYSYQLKTIAIPPSQSGHCSWERPNYFEK